VLLIVVNQALMGLYVTGQAQVLTVVGCLARDVVKRSPMVAGFFKCLCRKLLKSLAVSFTSINITVCFLLLYTFLLMEACWEFVVYVLSDNFLVSLLCSYARRPRWQSSRCVRRAFGALLWVKRVGRARGGARRNQFCVLGLRRRRLHTLRVMVSQLLPLPFFLGMPPVPVPKEVRRVVFRSLRAKCGGEPLSNGAAVLRRRGCTELEWACKSRSITVVILVWHTGTSPPASWTPKARRRYKDHKRRRRARRRRRRRRRRRWQGRYPDTARTWWRARRSSSRGTWRDRSSCTSP
jgi:hypothetical protein